MNSRYRLLYFFILVLISTSCKKPYLPPVITSPNSYLVVEGVINSGTDSTLIKLSRTVNLSNTVTSNPESKAIVSVVSDQNTSYPLIETAKGSYACRGLNLDNTHKYSLSIKTANGEQYASDFVAVDNSPAIDSVSFKIQTNGIQLYATTHNPQNNTRYYRWDFIETWIFHSNYESFFKSNGDTILFRDYVNDEIYQCWRSDSSSTILLGSSAKLTQDVISNTPITFVASNSEKLGVEYSILVRQYALTSDAYNFWLNMQTNSQQLGSIFDAQPSQVKGNIHSLSNPNEPVIGYVSVGSISSLRIFINAEQLPRLGSWNPTPEYPGCQIDSLYYKYKDPHTGQTENQINEYFNANKGAVELLIPIEAIAPPGSPPIGYTGSTSECVDCTLRGTNKRPAFWK